MTTTALTVPYSDVSPQEDVMEMSTDFDRHQGTDADTDIDIDLVPDQPQDQDSDYMIEDTRSEAGTGSQTFPNQTGNDDVMQDDGGSQGDNNEAYTLRDEDLDDAGDYIQENANEDSLALHGNTDEFGDDNLQRIDRITPQADRVFSALADTSEAKTRRWPEKDISNDREENILGSLGTEDNAEALQKNFHGTEIHNPTDLILESTRDELDWSEIPTSIGITETAQKTTNEDLDGGPRPEELTAKSGSSIPRPTEPQQDQGHDTTTVHPVVVVYQDVEISLFPPSDQSDSPTFFLHDEGLANSSIYDLLLACKEVLADSISEEDELELNIEELGLRISEECKSASHTTLSQILKIYLQLMHQDGTSDVGPLYMSLCTRTSFPKRLRGLVDAAKDGKGISELPYWNVPSDDGTATAADGDIAYGDAEDQTEETEAPDGATDNLRSDPVDTTSTLGQPAVSKDGSVVLEASNEQDSSQPPDIESFALNPERDEAPTSDGIIETTLSENRGSGDNEYDRITSSEQAQNTPHPQDRVTSAHFSEAKEDEVADLIDYENEEDPPIQESTDSSTLAGDEAAGTANEDERSGEYDPEIIPPTIEPTSNISTTVAVETEESIAPTREAVPAPEDITHHTNESQGKYQESGDDEDYDLGNDEEPFPPGADDATTKPFERRSQTRRAQDSEESVLATTNADGGGHGNDASGIPNAHYDNALKARGSEQQQLPDLNMLTNGSKPETDAICITSTQTEATTDEADQITDALETNQADFEGSRHSLSGNVEIVIGETEDAKPYAVASGSAADDDEITYDEDEIDDLEGQHTHDNHFDVDSSAPSKPISIKRPRGEPAEQDVSDDGSQGIKRVRSD